MLAGACWEATPESDSRDRPRRSTRADFDLGSGRRHLADRLGPRARCPPRTRGERHGPAGPDPPPRPPVDSAHSSPHLSPRLSFPTSFPFFSTPLPDQLSEEDRGLLYGHLGYSARGRAAPATSAGYWRPPRPPGALPSSHPLSPPGGLAMRGR